MQASASRDPYDQAPCGLLTTSGEGVIVRVNETFCKWFGYAEGDLLGRQRIQDLLTVGGRLFHQTHLMPLLEMQRSVSEVKLAMRRSDGSKMPMLINAVRRGHGEGMFDDFALVLITDRNKYEKELLLARKNAENALVAKAAAETALQEANRRKDEFLATLAHELRNPLAPIQAIVKLLKQRNSDDVQLTWSRDVLDRQVGQITRLVDDLLEASRVVEGKLELRIERVSVAALIEQAVEGSQRLIDESSHILLLTLPSEKIFFDVDPARFVQIIQNLLNNAAKYTPDGGKISLTVQRVNNELVISVKDNGIGIAAENLPTIFGIFAQLTPGLSRSQGGLGIGLSLVRSLTERLHGSVTATSDGVGKGSEFIVRFPLAADQSELNATPKFADPTPKIGSKRIVIVDDSEDAASSLAMLLEMDGHSVRTAENGAIGLQTIADFSPDTILLDINLPDMTGYDLAHAVRLRKCLSRPLLIAVTGWGGVSDKEKAIAAGFDFHLVKPVDYDRLLKLFARNPS